MEPKIETKEDDLALECICGGVTWHILKSGMIECSRCGNRREAPNTESPEES